MVNYPNWWQLTLLREVFLKKLNICHQTMLVSCLKYFIAFSQQKINKERNKIPKTIK